MPAAEVSGPAVEVAEGSDVTARFEPAGAVVSTRSSRVTVTTTAWGRAGDRVETAGVLAEASSARASYEHGAFTEWFGTRVEGIEHGFTIPAAPDGDGELVLSVRFEGELHPTLDHHGNVVLRDDEERRQAHYTHLHAFDATAEELPSWMTVEGDEVVIHVDDAGAAYPVTVDPLIWGLKQVLVLSEPPVPAAVAIDGDLALFGNQFAEPDALGQGIVMVVERVGGVWTETGVIRPNGTYGQIQFGASLDLEGDRAVVGALGDASTPGRAYVFERNSNGRWSTLSVLTAPDGVPGDSYAELVSIDASQTIVVAAPHATVAGEAEAGAAYLYQSGNFQMKLAEPTPTAGALFGASIEAQANGAIVGAPRADVGPKKGAFYLVFKPNSWVMLPAYPAPNDPTLGTDPQFGAAVALDPADSTVVMVGAPDWTNGFYTGVVYSVDLSGGGTVVGALTFELPAISPWGDHLSASTGYLVVGNQYSHSRVFQRAGPGQWVYPQDLDVRWGRISGSTVAGRADSAAHAHFYELAHENGDPCGADPDCSSDHCVDGVCCDAACGDGCDACDLPGSVGTCTVVAAGEPGDPVCAPYLCDGANSSCPTSCALDGDCVAASFCDAGACVPQLADGQACVGDNGCLGGVCTDGVCCASVCDGLCEACDVAGHVGMCWPVAAGDDPASECSDGACDGAGVCASDDGIACAGGGECLSGFCVDGVCCGSACDDLCETCAATDALGTCKPLGAGTDPDEECAMGACNGLGACELEVGQACGYDEACLSGFCVDGVCCDTACGDGDEDDCQACSVARGAGSDGICAPLAGGTLCREADEGCGGEESCDGTSVACPTDDAAPDGTACDDGDACTDGDACVAGACEPGDDVCGTGGGSDGAAGQGGSGTTGGEGGDGGGVAADEGCGCHVVGDPERGEDDGAWLLALLGLGVVRRRTGEGARSRLQ